MYETRLLGTIRHGLHPQSCIAVRHVRILTHRQESPVPCYFQLTYRADGSVRVRMRLAASSVRISCAASLRVDGSGGGGILAAGQLAAAEQQG